MSASSTYLQWLAVFLGLPLAVMWATHFRLLWSQRRAILAGALWALLISVPWDWWAIRMRVWTFPSDTHLGLWVGGIPLEEYLFIVGATMFVASFTLVLGARGGRWLTEPPPR
jgi:lycopene cyclase domain-containing protein